MSLYYNQVVKRMLDEKIGKRIQQCRKRKGLTQEQLAEQVDLSTNYISAVERGLHQLSTDNRVKVMTVRKEPQRLFFFGSAVDA